MIDKPLVSIGMPVYNGEQYIRRALDSLLAQDYENFKLIISDNASTDATLQICREYAERNNCITVHENSSNIGSHKNFQTVLKLAQGEYFMWAAVDDYWLPQFVSALVDELNRHPEAGVAMCAVDRIRGDGTLSPAGTVRFLGVDDPNKMTFLKMANKLALPLKYNFFIYGLFRTELLKSAIRLIPEIPSGDRWFLMQIALASRFHYVDRMLHIRTVHEKPYYERYPGDEFGRKRLLFDQKWFDFKPIPVVCIMLFRSDIIPPHRKLFIPIILSQIVYQRLVLGTRRMGRNFIVNYCPYKIQKRLLRGIK